MHEQEPTTPARKVLLIEDEHFIGELYIRALGRAGYDVTVVIDGQQGLEEALTDTYDIILLDIMIPTITGFEILQNLYDEAGNRRVHSKIVITTNLEQTEKNRAKVESQADGYIIKAEVTPRQLITFLEKL
ncbi:response regulator [Candidatus Saccharibacteria bacterium]|nr:MAG: response regulator [Candidatus Saccharibacteria bacterium]